VTAQINDLVSALEQIRSIVDGVLAGAKQKIKKKHLTSHKASTPNSLPEHVIQLRDRGFFKQPKTYNETHAELNSTYPCEPARVRVALIRVQKAKQLRKASKMVNGRKQNAYVW
jgi:hypothetical protein